MKITTLGYERTWNLGDYNSEKIISGCIIDEGEEASEALKNLIAFVNSKGDDKVNSAQPAEPKPKKDKKPKEDKPAKNTEPEPSDDNEEGGDNGEEKSEKEAKKETKVEKEKKPRKQTNTPYDPDNALHKKLVGEFLDKKAPKWRSNTDPYKLASRELSGSDFQDAEGMVLDSFVSEFLKEVEKQKGL